ncbi:patatin-like phospholipase family protein [Rhodalgimonas zhirmunskyi]|uniref:Patatin-like phospholipase family protein n=1 Tax=Rhodalgimonas zhirmunskyi TaxID=2964767 RepID=A0AAJ1U353_9RHOB|nr:patatin-like phospholipase family protein [Rhodoalgimonas zhirmunskyi]MDQ2092800.1 patatin-like phospholipase family protein [Rhodoalgimonas zhirmunskyi]
MTTRINLALQGGGAHGAFTWGVIDRLLDEPEIEIAAISGTSAGALNGAALKAGLMRGGVEDARDNLDWVWEQMGAIDLPGMPEWMGMSQISHMMGVSLPFFVAESWERMVSPYATGPFYENPLRRIVEKFDFEKVCHADGPPLFVGATNVRTGKVRVFSGDEIGPEAIMASACLPTVFRAVEIGEEAYWDGGYSGNPPLFPLYREDLPPDIVIVNINPLRRDEVPKSPADIRNRINEVSFNSALLRELRAIEFAQRLLDQGAVKEGALKRLYIHMIADDALMNELSVATKMLPMPQVMLELKAAGRRAADGFLEDHAGKLGKMPSANLDDIFD